MRKLTKDQMLPKADPDVATYTNSFWVMLFAVIVMVAMLSGCGSSSSSSQSSSSLSGNWQFTVSGQDGFVNTPDLTSGSGLQGGFLLQNNSSFTGGFVYSNTLNSQTSPCNAGSAPVTLVSAQPLTLTVAAGAQTYTLTGTLNSDGSLSGTYTVTPGPMVQNNGGETPCGEGTDAAGGPLAWTAKPVAPVTGTVQGSFHSTQLGGNLINQDFLVAGSLSQGENIGASNATVTGQLSFLNASGISDYPCFGTAYVNGQVSGGSLILQLIGADGTNYGQIGEAVASSGSTGLQPVTFHSVSGGNIISGINGAGPSYIVASKACPGNLSGVTTSGDSGNICLSLGSTACQQPITLSPALVTFPAQLLGSAPVSQTITVTNITSSSITGVTLSFNPFYSYIPFDGGSDFNGLPSFPETDSCGAGGSFSNGQPFSLSAGQSCTVTVTFSPQESCPWLPSGITGTGFFLPPAFCPFTQPATLVLTNPNGNPYDSDDNVSVPVTGIGLSALQPSVGELDFSSESQSNPAEASQPQILTFTNASPNPVQILASAPCTNQSSNSHNTLPHPILVNSPVAGLQVVANGTGTTFNITPDNDTIDYRCDSDTQSTLPNFQISQDSCTGVLLTPQASCSLQIAYVPQPATPIGSSGLDFFLELNTVQCAGSVTTDCEIDSGRFPVELISNGPSPIRMSPAAGLNFGNQPQGTSSAAQAITLTNDQALTSPLTVTFIGKILASGSYSESDDCPATLAPGASCTVNVKFKPSKTGFIPGKLTINYTQTTAGGVSTTGNPQFVYLRGAGQ